MLGAICESTCADLMGCFPPLAAHPASSSDLMQSQSQRQLGQSDKPRSNADLVRRPAALFARPYCRFSFINSMSSTGTQCRQNQLLNSTEIYNAGMGARAATAWDRDEVSGIFWVDTNNVPPAATRRPQGFI